MKKHSGGIRHGTCILRSATGFGSTVLTAIVLSLVPAPAGAQQTAQASATASNNENETVKMEAFVVEGSLEGQAKANQETKQAVNLINMISSDKMGTFPDLNAAEALGRLPGVTVVQSGGEGRFVTIRGANETFNGTLLNGFELPPADEELRRNDLVTIANALIDSIQVTKAAMPDLPANGIGGVTNIMMKNPLDLKGREIRAEVYYGSNDQGSGDERESFSYGDFIGKDHKLAFLISGNRRISKYYFDETQGDTPSMYTGSDGSTVYLPDKIRYQRTDTKNKNYGIDAALGYQAGDNTRFLLRAFYSDYPKYRNIHRITLNTNDAWRNSNGTAADLTQGGGLVNMRYQRLERNQNWNLRVKGVQFIGTTKVSDSLKLDYGYSYTKSYEIYENDMYVNQARVNNIGEPLRLRMNGETLSLTPTGPLSEAVMFDTSTQRIASIIDGGQRNAWKSSNNPYINVTKQFQLSNGGTLDWKSGVYLELQEQNNPYTYFLTVPAAGQTPTFALLGNGGTLSDFGGKGFSLGSKPVPDSLVHVYKNNPTLFAPETDSGTFSLTYPFFAKENIYSGYSMGTYTRDNLTLTAGVRYERTREKFTRYTDNGSGSFANKTFTGSYDNFLPSVHLKYAVQDNMFVRASWSNTVARPNPVDLYQAESIDIANLTIFEPNPALKALNSSNFDVSFDWYSGALGQFMVAGFVKDIKNFPFNISDNVTINGSVYDRTTVVGNSDGKITGWEAAFKRKFDFLPGILGGFGVDLNYCQLDSELESPVRPDNPNLVGQASYTYNIGVYYARRDVFVQLAYHCQGESIDEYGDTPNFDTLRAPQGIYDLTASYAFGRDKHFQVFAEWRNITNEPELYRVRGDAPGKGDVLIDRIVSGSDFGGGVRLRF